MTLEEDFAQLMAAADSPLYIVTTVGADGERSGCLIGFATQCSIHPPRFLAGLSVTNHTFGVAATATHLGVHVLDRGEKPLAELFGGETGDLVDKFERCAWREGPHGVPILDDVDAWFVGRILERVDLGDHHGHVLEPVAAHPAPRENLRLGDAHDIEAGHSADESDAS